ncbi:MAG: PTS sugar transporter subunit IIA [Oligosphaeraceae bacterium]
MRLSDLLTPQLIKMELESTDREGVFEELVSLMLRQGVIHDREQALAKLREREAKMSTGISHGLALPHGKLGDVNGVAMCVGISREGVDYGSLDHEPVQVVVMVFSETGNPGPHIQALSEIARMFGNDGFMRQVLGARSAEEILRLIRGEE